MSGPIATTADPRSPTPRVLVVEHYAHRTHGHFPKRFAELADGFVVAGAEVEVLTALGWATGDGHETRWPLHTYSRLSRALFRLAERGPSDPLRAGPLANLLRTAVLLFEARRRTRRWKAPSGVVCLAMNTHPALLAAVHGRRPWIVHLFHPAPVRSRLLRSVDAVGRRVGRFRSTDARRAGVTLALPSPEWAVPDPGLTTIAVRALPLAGSRPVAAVHDARQRLGVPPGRRVALLFGSHHWFHDPATVLEAFRDQADWQLVVGGRVVAALEGTDLRTWAVPPVLVNERAAFVPDERRDLAFEAADVVVLSFRDGYAQNSGMLMDAASHGRPVLVSSGSAAAELVAAHGAGAVFTAGSPTSLVEALSRIDLEACRSGMERLCDARSNEEVARLHLDALFGP